MNYEHQFFIFLLENYACAKKRSTGDVLREWDQLGITDEIFKNFPIYHQEALSNAYTDIDSLVNTGRHAY